MLKIVLTLIVSMLTVSCGGPRYIDYFPCHDDGRAKPQVALVPVLVPSNYTGATDLSRELTNKMRMDIMNDGELYLFSNAEVHEGLSRINQVDLLTSGEDFARSFCSADFVVLTELIHTPVSPTCLQGTTLYQHNFIVKLRIKIIDLRPRCPRVVLQEIMTGDYPIPCTLEEINSGILNGCLDNKDSPYGRAHHRLVCWSVKRIEEVIRSAY